MILPVSTSSPVQMTSMRMVRLSETLSAHQERGGDLAPHGLDLVAADTGGVEGRHEHLPAVGGRRVHRLAEVGAEDDVLGPDGPGRRNAAARTPWHLARGAGAVPAPRGRLGRGAMAAPLGESDRSERAGAAGAQEGAR